VVRPVMRVGEWGGLLGNMVLLDYAARLVDDPNGLEPGTNLGNMGRLVDPKDTQRRSQRRRDVLDDGHEGMVQQHLFLGILLLFQKNILLVTIVRGTPLPLPENTPCHPITTLF